MRERIPPSAGSEDLARRMRRALHRHPELGHRENWTAGYVERVLRLFGLRPWRPAPTSVAAIVGPSDRSPVVGFRADLDALPIAEGTHAGYASRVPGRMHACGHDGHTAALLLLAHRLAADPPDDPVLLVFQQAEEVHPSGAKSVLTALPADLLQCDFYAMHLWPELPAGTVGIREGAVLASVAGVTIRVTGRRGRSHGSRAEEEGVDALAAGIMTYEALLSGSTGRVLDAATPSALLLGEVHGGESPNRVATGCVLTGTLRALSHADERAAIARIERTAARIAARTGAGIDVAVETGIRPPVINSPAAARRVIAACESAGVLWRSYPERPLGVSDDFGWYLDCGGALVLVGCGSGPEHPDLHTPTFDFDEAILAMIAVVFESIARRNEA